MDGVVTVRFSMTSISTMLGRTPLDTDRNTFCRASATAKEKETDNEKYAFRCFLLRLGFIGAEYKGERKTLLRNLSGSSAFRSGSRKVDAEEAENE